MQINKTNLSNINKFVSKLKDLPKKKKKYINSLDINETDDVVKTCF